MSLNRLTKRSGASSIGRRDSPFAPSPLAGEGRVRGDSFVPSPLAGEGRVRGDFSPAGALAATTSVPQAATRARHARPSPALAIRFIAAPLRSRSPTILLNPRGRGHYRRFGCTRTHGRRRVPRAACQPVIVIMPLTMCVESTHMVNSTTGSRVGKQPVAHKNDNSRAATWGRPYERPASRYRSFGASRLTFHRSRRRTESMPSLAPFDWPHDPWHSSRILCGPAARRTGPGSARGP